MRSFAWVLLVVILVLVHACPVMATPLLVNNDNGSSFIYLEQDTHYFLGIGCGYLHNNEDSIGIIITIPPELNIGCFAVINLGPIVLTSQIYFAAYGTLFESEALYIFSDDTLLLGVGGGFTVRFIPYLTPEIEEIYPEVVVGLKTSYNLSIYLTCGYLINPKGYKFADMVTGKLGLTYAFD